MNSLTVKILAGLVSVLMLTTICTQFYYALHDKHDTEEAVLTTINENISFQGVVVRDEKVVTYDGGGILDYEYTDGSKVSVNNTIAEVYSSEDAIIKKNKIALIDEEIANLKKAQNPGITNYVEPESIKSKIDKQYKELLSNTADGNFSEVSRIKSELLVVMNIYNIVTKSETSYDDKISQLEAEKEKLEAGAKAPDNVITADETGYFVSYADGYEDKLTLENVGELSEGDIKEVIKGNANAPKNAVGKVFYDYSCNIVGVVPTDSRIAEGANMTIMLSTSTNIYDVVVESVKITGDDDEKMVVVLSCDRLDENLVESRVLSAELIFDEYQGIKVPRDAIRFQGEQKGVYVILGKDISFKKIDVIYEGKDYVLSKNTSDEEYLLLYDQILLEVVSSDDVSQSSKSDSTNSSAE